MPESTTNYHKRVSAAKCNLYGSRPDLCFPSIRHHSKQDKHGQPVLMPAKEERTMENLANDLVGCFCRGGHGGKLNRRSWVLSEEDVALLNSGDWLCVWDEPTAAERKHGTGPQMRKLKAALRAASQNNDGTLTALSSEKKRLLSLAQLCEKVNTENALAMKEDLMQYRHNLSLYVEIHGRGERAAADKAAATKRPAEDSVESEEEKRPRGSDDVMTEIGGTDYNYSDDDDDAESASDSDSAPASVASEPSPRTESAVFVEKAQETIRAGKEAIEWLNEQLIAANAACEIEDDEVRRLAVRASLIGHEFRRALFEANDGVRMATEIGCDLSDGRTGYEPLRNDWAHVTYDTGPFRVELGDNGSCVWRLERTNKNGTRNYAQDIGARSPEFARLLLSWKPIAYAMRRPGQQEAPVLFIVEGKDEIGRMLARTGGNRLNHAGFDDGPIGERRKAWFKRVNRKLKDQGAAPLSMKTCKPRHIVELCRRGTAEDRAAAEAARDSTNPHYGSGSTADGRAAAAAAVAR
eukprot:COSAG04_NODE_2920_length_3383_cov_6.032887_1_plen_523_part_00